MELYDDIELEYLNIYGREFRYYNGIPAPKFVRFLDRINFTDDCWIWMGGRSAEYGAFSWEDRNFGAHRFAWIALRGPIPAGFQLHHKCENPSCVNPDHLIPLHPKEHLLEHTPENPVSRNRKKEFCHKGHALRGDNVRYAYEGTSVHRICRICRREWEADKRRKSHRPAKGTKTHCKYGHSLLDPANVHVDHIGKIRCKTCHNEASARAYAKAHPPKPAKEPRTHCANGHPWQAPHIYERWQDGKRVVACMTCHKEGQKKAYEKRKAEFAAKRAAPSAMLDLGGGE